MRYAPYDLEQTLQCQIRRIVRPDPLFKLTGSITTESRPIRPTKKNQRKPCFDLNDDGSSPFWDHHNIVTTTAMNTRRTSCCCSPSPENLTSNSKRTYLNAIAKLSVVYDVAVSHSEKNPSILIAAKRLRLRDL